MSENTEVNIDLASIRQETSAVVKELVEVSKIKKGELFVIGCSSSEIIGHKIGTETNLEVATAVFEGIMEVLAPLGIYPAFQCCEHLNRAMVVSEAAMERYDLERVNVIPQPNHAGGALGTIAYQNLSDAVMVENIRAKAKAGLDIGCTLIGMHMHPVVVPVRLSVNHIGKAPIICARYRAKYVGGPRAIYEESLM